MLAAYRSTGHLPAVDACDRAVRLARRVVGCPRAVVSLVRADGSVAQAPVGGGVAEAGEDLRLTRCVAERVIAEGRPLLVDEVQADASHRTEMQAFAAVPLRAGDGGVVGCLFAMDGVPRRWTAADREALEDVAMGLAAEIGRESEAAELVLSAEADAESALASIGELAVHAEGEADLGAMERLRDEFISLVSHELRTPLTALRGSLGLLRAGLAGPLGEQSSRLLAIATRNTDRLVRLTQDILDLEQLACGRAELRPRPVPAHRLVDDALAQIAARAGEAGIQVESTVGDVQVLADEEQIGRVLRNLLENAVKFSGPGTRVQVTGEVHGGVVTMRVRDEGCGIPAAHIDTVFERFRQADSSDSRVASGPGLGLALARAIVEQHGGRIWVESTPGAGSLFSFTLPRVAADPTGEAAVAGG